jgi:hypothetical protein
MTGFIVEYPGNQQSGCEWRLENPGIGRRGKHRSECASAAPMQNEAAEA